MNHSTIGISVNMKDEPQAESVSLPSSLLTLWWRQVKNMVSQLPERMAGAFKKRVKVVDEEWDILIVLDACRFDYFARTNSIEGLLSKKISAGSSTPDWVQHNFDKEVSDVVYVSANPYISHYMLKKMIGFNPFYCIDEVWDYGWDNTLKTVSPEKVSIAAAKAIEKYRDKRVIVHYMQPHHPFICDPDLVHDGWQKARNSIRRKRSVEDVVHYNVFDLAKRGLVDVARIKEGYSENLKLVLGEVEKLLDNTEGCTVVTSDHGECFGENGVYGHPSQRFMKYLVEIPWLVVNR